MEKTAIVTGAAGFIGSHLVEKLLKEKFRVIGIDCFTDYYSKQIKENNLKNSLKNENFSLIKKDINKLELPPIFNKADYIFHSAAQPGVRASWGEQFTTYLNDNILSTQKILETAKSCRNIKKIIIASSSSVYGNQTGKMNEETTMTKPVSPYGATKLVTENLGYLYFKNFGLPVTSLRYFTVFGPRQRPDMAFTRFIVSSLGKKPISVYGDGTQSRDFTFVDDIVNANFQCIEHDLEGEVINIGGGNIITVNKVIQKIENILQIPIEINNSDVQKGDVKHTKADISKAEKILNYLPKTKIDEGLSKQVEYIKNNLYLYTK